MSSRLRCAYYLAATLGSLVLSAFASAQLPPPGDPPDKAGGFWRIAHTTPVWTGYATDVGRVEPSRGLSRMVLVLLPSSEKQKALQKFLDDVQNRQSPQFHHWLTPAEFGARFGAEDADTEAVRQWLERSGFRVAPAAQSKLWVEFSGTAQQVEFAFHSELHYYEWRGKKYMANATDIAMPAQFAAISRGVVSLDNFGKRPPRLMQGSPRVQPNLTATGQTNIYYLAPGDFSTIYNTKGLLSSGYDGTGISIAVTAQSDIELPDVQAFRQIFVSSQPNDPNFIVSGPDPGLVGPVDLQEAQLDVEWAGGVAPGATINLVVAGSTDTTSGVDLAAAYAIDNRIAPILTYTYGACEALLTPTQNAFYNALWQQAAAEGITVLVATGDNGAAGCDSATSGTPAIHGPAVNGAATTPYNVAVGGTQFADTSNPSTYWGSNNSMFSSALGYIPEAVWNESCDPGQTLTATNCVFGSDNFSLLASSGGASTLYTKPSWQAGPGVPADGARDVPDLALAAAASHDDIVYCNSTTGSPCQINGQGEVVGLTLVGGTSVSTPAMAGILALVEEKNGAYQGQINYILYQLAQSRSCISSTQTNPTAQNSCVFYDITTGDNSVPCLGGSPDCSSQQTGMNGELAGSAAGPGYDLATGLGSVNATNLADFWNTVSLTTTQTTLEALPSSFLHGTSVAVSGTVSPSSGSGAPSGIVSLNTGSSGSAPDVLMLAGRAFSQSVSDLPGGNYTLSAHYSGDAMFAASDSSGVAVTVTPEPSTTSLTVNGLRSAGSANYGSLQNVVVAIAGNSGMGKPTGTVTLTDGTTTVGTYALTADGRVSIPIGGSSGFSFAPGPHSLTASYSGDNSFQPSSSSSVPFVITKGTPFVVVGANSSNIPVGQSLGVHAIVSPTGTANATGTVQFTVDGAVSGSPVPLQEGGLFGTQAQASSILTGLAAGPHVIGAIYDGSGDPNYSSVPAGNGPNEFAPTVTVGNGTGTGNSTTSLAVITAPVTLGDSGSFNVSITPATATGTVTLWDAVGPRSSAVNIAGGAANIQVEWTQAGSFSVYAVYSGDPSNAASSSALRSFIVQQGTPQVSLALQNPVGGSLQTSLNASVSGNLKNGTLSSPTGFVEFWDALNGGAPRLLSVLQLTAGPGGASVAAARVRLVNGIHSLHAHYRGDNNWSAADSATTGAPSFSLSAAPSPASLKGGSTGTATITVTPSGGFTGTVALSCPTGGTFALAGYTCSFNPPQVNITDANPQSVTLTFTPPTIATVALAAVPAIPTAPRATFWRGLGLCMVALVLASWVYLVSRLLQRSRAVFRGAWARGCGAVLASLVVGCGGGGGGNGGGGPVVTTTMLSVEQVSNQLRVTVSVNSPGATPSGTINLVVDGGAPLSGSVSAGLTTFSFQPIPLVGIHTLEARYLGDLRNQPSDSGEQTALITGNTTIEVLGTSGGNGATTVLPVSVN